MKFRLPLLLLLAFAISAVAQDVPVHRIVARDGKLEPATIEVAAGQRFKLEVKNESKKAIEFESKDLKQEKVIAPGATATFTINALKTGEYRFFDEFNEKTSQGKIVAR